MEDSVLCVFAKISGTQVLAWREVDVIDEAQSQNLGWSAPPPPNRLVCLTLSRAGTPQRATWRVCHTWDVYSAQSPASRKGPRAQPQGWEFSPRSLPRVCNLKTLAVLLMKENQIKCPK